MYLINLAIMLQRNTQWTISIRKKGRKFIVMSVIGSSQLCDSIGDTGYKLEGILAGWVPPVLA